MPKPRFSKAMGELIAYLQKEMEGYAGPEQRTHKRVELPPIPVVVQQLNEDLEPVGKAFSAIIRNVSASGIGLTFGEHVESEFIQIRGVLPSGKILKTIVRVRHCTPAGVMIGGEFLEKKPPELL